MASEGVKYWAKSTFPPAAVTLPLLVESINSSRIIGNTSVKNAERGVRIRVFRPACTQTANSLIGPPVA